jgi:flagellar hook-associated protein 2
MGTVGISFGSPTAGTGFDVSSTVSQIVANLQNIESPWKSQLASYQAQDTVISNLGSLLSTLSKDVQSFTDFQGVLAEKQGSSSDPGVLALTSASSSAIAGTHTIVVNSLAATSSGYLNAITNASDTLSGSLTIQVGSGTAQTITVGSNSNTLSGLAAEINSAGIGVTASVLTDTSGSRLSLVSGTSGAGGDLTINSSITDSTTGTALAYHTANSGANASLTVDGAAISTASNTVSTVIPGVTFQLLAPSPVTGGTAESVQVQILNDNTAVESSINQFVSDYNAVITAVNAQETTSSSGAAPALFGTPTLTLLQEQLLGAINTTNSQGDINSLTQLGVTVNNDGTLSLDTNALNSELNSDYSGVVSFFQNPNSWGTEFSNTLNNLGTTAVTGTLALAQKSNASSESSLNTDISNEERLISVQQVSLTLELTSANEILQSIPSNLNSVSELYSAITGYQAPKF